MQRSDSVWRPTYKAVAIRPLPGQRAIFAEAARAQKEMANLIYKEILAMRDQVDIGELARLIPSAQDEQIFASLNAIQVGNMSEALTEAIHAAALAGARTAAKEWGSTVVVDMARPRIFDWVRNRTGELIKETRGTNLEAIRNTIGWGVENGIHPARLAQNIQQAIGLTGPGAEAVNRRRQSLIDQGVKPKQANSIADGYANKLVTQRAKVIAHHEGMSAINRGRQSLWESLVDSGAMPADSKKRWVTSRDEATCPICQPLGYQKDIGIMDLFTTSRGEKIQGPPAHVGCRCNVAAIETIKGKQS
jgi:hypothetical protein